MPRPPTPVEQQVDKVEIAAPEPPVTAAPEIAANSESMHVSSLRKLNEEIVSFVKVHDLPLSDKDRWERSIAVKPERLQDWVKTYAGLKSEWEDIQAWKLKHRSPNGAHYAEIESLHRDLGEIIVEIQAILTLRANESGGKKGGGHGGGGANGGAAPPAASVGGGEVRGPTESEKDGSGNIAMELNEWRALWAPRQVFKRLNREFSIGYIRMTPLRLALTIFLVALFWSIPAAAPFAAMAMLPPPIGGNKEFSQWQQGDVITLQDAYGVPRTFKMLHTTPMGDWLASELDASGKEIFGTLVFSRHIEKDELTYTDPHFGEMIFDRFFIDPTEEVAVFEFKNRFAEDREKERIRREGVGTLFRVLPLEQYTQVLTRAQTPGVNWDDITLNSQLKYGALSTTSLTPVYEWAKSAYFPGAPVQDYASWVFAVFPQSEPDMQAEQFTPVVRSGMEISPKIAGYKDLARQMNRSLEYTVEPATVLNFRHALLIKDADEAKKLYDANPRDRDEALRVLNRSESEQQAWERSLLQVEQRPTSRAQRVSINESVKQRMVNRLEAARKKGLFGVLSVAMEMPVKNGGKIIKPEFGGGQGVYMEDQPWAASQKGVAGAIFAPLASDDVKKYYGSLDAYLKAYNGDVLMDLDIPVGRGSILLKVLYIEQDGVPVLQLYDPSGHFFKSIYHDPPSGSVGGFIEAILLPRAAVEIQRRLGLQFEAMHFNDWQAALGPVILKELYGNAAWPQGHLPASLLTIHNLEYQGVFPRYMDIQSADADLRRYLQGRGVIGGETSIDLFSLTHLRPELRDLTEGGFEWWGQLNLMKAGIEHATKVPFVSHGHAKEAVTEKRGYGMDGVLRSLHHKITAIYNGIRAAKHRAENLPMLDRDGFSRPAKPLAQMSPDELMSWKAANRGALQNKLGLENNPNHLVLGFVTRIVKQKGLNILMTPMPGGKTLLENLLDLRDPRTGGKVQIVILGTPGDGFGEAQARFFEDFVKRHPKHASHFKFVKGFDSDLAKQIGAGSDLMGMFSIDEPGGLANQELALLLAKVICTDRGGLQDFVDHHGTPAEPVEGFEIEDTLADRRQRSRSASQILDRAQNQLWMYHHDRRKYMGELKRLAHFNPDWGERAKFYVKAYAEAIRSVKWPKAAGASKMKKAAVIKAMKQDRLEAGLHTVTGGKGYAALGLALIVEFAEILLSKRVIPGVDQLDILQALRQKRENGKHPIVFLLEDRLHLAEEAAASGANVLIGSGFTPAFVERIRRRFPNVVFIAEISNQSSNVEQELKSAIASGVDGVMLKRWADWKNQYAKGPLSLQEIRKRHPKLLMMVAGGIFENSVTDTLALAEDVIVAVGVNAQTPEDFEAQAQNYATGAEGIPPAAKSRATALAAAAGSLVMGGILVGLAMSLQSGRLIDGVLVWTAASALLFVEEYLFMRRRGLNQIGRRNADGSIWTHSNLGPFRARRVAWHEKLVHVIPGGTVADMFIAPIADWLALGLAALGFRAHVSENRTLIEAGNLPLDQQLGVIKDLVQNANRLNLAVALRAPLQVGRPIEVSLVPREWSADPENPFGTLAEIFDWQRQTVDHHAQAFFKIVDDGASIDSSRFAIPGQASQSVEFAINLPRASRPGGGGISQECTLCTEVIQQKFVNELWMKLGLLKLYFNPFSVWPSKTKGDRLEAPYHVVATWGDEHVPQSRIVEADYLKELRVRWMQMNASPTLSGLAKFRMMLNGWNYDPQNLENHGGASQDHIHAHWVRKAFPSEEAPVLWSPETAAGHPEVKVGIVELLPGRINSHADDQVALVLEASDGHLEDLDVVLSNVLKMITGNKDSFNVFMYETPATNGSGPAVRYILTGRKKAVPSGARGAFGAPQAIGREMIIEDIAQRFYHFSPEQSAAFESTAPEDRIHWIQTEKHAGRLTIRPREQLLADYGRGLRETTYSRNQVENLLDRVTRGEDPAPGIPSSGGGASSPAGIEGIKRMAGAA
ncbi:MAG: hypothetical protein A2992_01210 [Elusimicrobia bacterium RIFCSPLOWO2_01_FULL_59_12]|nr:MAG: hypothetical protein A2992_01210 [Elusimicrobia bacterium RIFCSPLOWO2_01_FULL_59_12]